jgi:hypothetical protein
MRPLGGAPGDRASRQRASRRRAKVAERVIRTLEPCLDCVSYRFHDAKAAVDAIDAVVPCPLLLATAAEAPWRHTIDPYHSDTNWELRRPTNLSRCCSRGAKNSEPSPAPHSAPRYPPLPQRSLRRARARRPSTPHRFIENRDQLVDVRLIINGLNQHSQVR